MSAIDEYLGELERLKSATAIESLTNPVSHDAYGLGVAIGMQKGLDIAKAALEKILSNGDGNNGKEFAGQRPLIDRTPRPRANRTG